MMAPAGYALDGINGYFNTLKATSTSTSAKAAISTIQGVTNIASSAVGVDAVSQAKAWQGIGMYPGVDDWSSVTIKKGSYVWGGTPGQSEFYTTTADIMASGNDANKIFKGLQVGTTSEFPIYRNGMTMYNVPYDMDVAVSQALANPQFGSGGYTQFFIPNYKDLQEESTMILKNLVPKE